MKTNTIKLACAALLTLSVAVISTSVSAEVSNNNYPSRDAGYIYSRGEAPDYGTNYPSRDAGYIYSRGEAPDYGTNYPSRDAGYIYSRGEAPDYGTNYPSRDAGYIYSRGEAPESINDMLLKLIKMLGK
ncbi:hypothetical protein ACVRW4_05755 [Streptococcus phocae subsp. phocae]|uniref:Uncharacterized protein n=1 Tax=Streptococcus phocae TaxID=119224 RepID=A0A0P6S6M7_9STRE|nr:hypothetical protein [Streptococcus phocae]KPJ22817.1 hypothetical protein AKK44_02700 [Streptococcus phocae]